MKCVCDRPSPRQVNAGMSRSACRQDPCNVAGVDGAVSNVLIIGDDPVSRTWRGHRIAWGNAGAARGKMGTNISRAPNGSMADTWAKSRCGK